MSPSPREQISDDRLTGELVDCFLKVHRAFGPGLLESVYEDCLAHELKKRGIPFERQKPIPLYYEGERISSTLRLDLLVDNRVIVELKHPAPT